MEKEIPNKFTFTAAYKNSERIGEYYHHFGLITTMLSLYGVEENNLRTVVLEVIPDVNLCNRKETNEIDYWGFWNYKTNKLSLIYPTFVQFNLCFPYGAKSEEESESGKCLNLKIIDVKLYEQPT